MKTKPTDIAFAPEVTLTKVTLEACPARILAFVQGGSHAALRHKLLPLGWKTAASEAWALLAALNDPSVLELATCGPDPVAEAIAACERWQHTGLLRARARVRLRFREQAAFLFPHESPGLGLAAVIQIMVFLDRREELARGDGRPPGSRPADRAALALLEDAGITKAVVKELEALATQARWVPVREKAEQEEEDAAAARREIVLRKMHAWLTAWSGIARTVITRRDELIRLGIARRRARRAKAAATRVARRGSEDLAPPSRAA